MYRYLRFAAQSLVAFCFLFVFNSTLLSQEIALKSKYSYTTPALESAQKLYNQGNYAEALDAFEGIIGHAEVRQNYEEVVYAMEKKALALRRLNRQNEAIEIMDDAIKLALQKLPKGHFLISKMYYTRGTTDHRLRDYYSARAYLDTSLVYYNNSNTYDSTAYYRMVEYKYYAYEYSEGSTDTLIKYLDQLMRLESIRQTKVSKPDVVLNLMQGYPKIYTQKGDFEQALAHAIQSYKFAKENRKEVSNRYYAEALYDLAGVLYFKKEYLKALEIGLEAMPIVESTPRAAMPEYFAFNNLLGVIYSSIGKYTDALPYFNKAAAVPYREGSVSQRRSRIAFYAQVIMNMGICYRNLGQSKKAKDHLDLSLKLRKSIVAIPSPDFHSIYDYLGNYFFQDSDWENALISYDSALRNGLKSYQADIYSFPEEESTISYKDLKTLTKKTSSLGQLGKSRESVDLLIDAKKYAQKTSDVLMDRREDFAVSEGKLFLSENFKSLYETGIDVCFELYSKTGDATYFDEAMNFSRQSKALLFLEQSQEFKLVSSNSLPQEKKELFFESKRKTEALQQSFYELIRGSMTSDSVIKVNDELLRSRIENLRIKGEIESVLSELGEDTSVFTDIFTGTSGTYVPRGKALIEFFYGEKNIYILAKSLEIVSFQRVEVEEDIESAIQNVVKIVSAVPNIERLSYEFESFRESSSFVFNKLIKHALAKLGSELKHLVIVPDEFLSRLPFEVLIQNDNSNATGFNNLNYLTKSYRIQYELSSELFDRDQKTTIANGGLLGVGFKEVSFSSTRGAYGSLPGTEEEIKFLQSNIEGSYLIGNTGTKANFLDKARGYDVLHLAVHGRADNSSRYESSLIFNGKGDNILNTNDLYLAGLQARLAVLSACESGLGVVNKGEGTFSIARGFALVGVPSVVMSLWKVNDKVTSDIMVNMYRGFINKGKPINEALRDAKLSYLESGDEYSSHPYYWAAFLQLGEDISIDEGRATRYQKHLWQVLLVLITLSTLLLYYIRVKRERAK